MSIYPPRTAAMIAIARELEGIVTDGEAVSGNVRAELRMKVFLHFAALPDAAVFTVAQELGLDFGWEKSIKERKKTLASRVFSKGGNNNDEQHSNDR